jgi:hypothetical protein
MGALLVACGEARRVLPLPTACIVGRGPACLVRVDHPACPAHWLELRWRGDGWAWRALNAAERTRATGAFIGDGWRAMEVGPVRGTRVSLAGEAWIELVDAGPPEPFAWDVLADAPLTGDALDEVAERRGEALLPLSAEGDATQALADGACWLHVGPDGPRTLRAHVPAPFTPTLTTKIDLGRGGVHVEIDLAAQSATFVQGDARVSITGACVRTLTTYARARSADGGWLTAEEAWLAWSELGGPDGPPREVVAWERARLRRLLDRAGVAGVDALFTVRKEGGLARVRLGDAIVEALEVG